MWKPFCVLALLTAIPAAAQDYTVIGVGHADSSITEVHPVTGMALRRFIVMPGDLRGEAHEACVSSDGKTAYVAIPYAKHILILDLETFKPKGKIESEYFSRTPHVRRTSRFVDEKSTTADPHGVALNKDETKLYITLEFADKPGVAVYDVKAGKVTKKIETLVGNWLGVHPRTDKLYLPTGDTDKVVVIDTNTDQIIKTIDLHKGSAPAGVGFGGPNGEVWINGDGDGSVTVIDASTDTVIKVIQPRVKGGGRVAGSPDGRFVASAAGNEVSIIDTQTKEIVASLPISPEGMRSGHGYPVFSPDSNTLHVMNESTDDMVTFTMRDLKAPGKRSAQVGGNFFGGGIRVLKK